MAINRAAFAAEGMRLDSARAEALAVALEEGARAAKGCASRGP